MLRAIQLAHMLGGGGREDLAVAEMAALMRFPLPRYHFTIASLPGKIHFPSEIQARGCLKVSFMRVKRSRAA